LRKYKSGKIKEHPFLNKTLNQLFIAPDELIKELDNCRMVELGNKSLFEAHSHPELDSGSDISESTRFSMTIPIFIGKLSTTTKHHNHLSAEILIC
jgi:hypothetical protein